MSELPVVLQHEVHAVDGQEKLQPVPHHDLRHQGGPHTDSLAGDLGQEEDRVEGGEGQPDHEVGGEPGVSETENHY